LSHLLKIEDLEPYPELLGLLSVVSGTKKAALRSLVEKGG
jgi:hypothetical protein